MKKPEMERLAVKQLLTRNFAFLLLAPLFLLVVFSPLLLFSPASASHCPEKDYDCRIAEIQAIIDALKPAHERNKQELAELEDQLADIQEKLDSLAVQLQQLGVEIAVREEDLALQEELLHRRIRSFYIFSRQYSPILVFLASQTATEFTRELTLREQVAAEDRRIIEELSAEILSLREDKSTLERSRSGLQSLQAQVDQRAQFLSGEVEKVEAAIAELTARQQALLAARSGAFNISLGSAIAAIPCSGRPGSDQYCHPGSNYYAAFSFGAWTHRKGMSQFGAWGRAKSGQSFQDILAKYYPEGSLQTRSDLPGSINTDQGTKPFETDYLYGIAEMPSSWTENDSAALKAQAIAARTYALYYIGWPGGNRTICTSQSCQVYLASKVGSAEAQAWRDAVDATRGMVVLGGDGRPVGAFYSSTAGGYLTTSGWDTTDGSGGDLFGKAYENIAGSPWFYSAWYTQSYTSSSAKCGRSHPWLTSEEMADILNAYIVLRHTSDERIIPETIGSCPISGVSGNPYSKDELRAKAAQFETAITSVSGVSTATIAGSGETSSFTFQTNRGSFGVDGSSFKTAFNLRAPGHIALRSPMFNLERSQ